MSGQDSIRGFVFQTIIAILESLDSEWSYVCLEPNDSEDKTDIRWTLNDNSKVVCQVKSSINNFEKNDVLKWLLDLYKDCQDAKEYQMTLVGNCSTETQSFFNKIKKKEHKDFGEKYSSLFDVKDKIQIAFYPFKRNTLEESIIAKIDKFLNANQILVEYRAKELVAKGLLYSFFGFSTIGQDISKEDFEDKLLSWIRLTFSNHIKANSHLELSFYISRTIDFCKEIPIYSLPEIKDTDFVNESKEAIIKLIKEIEEISIENTNSVDSDESVFANSILDLGDINSYFIPDEIQNEINAVITKYFDLNLTENFFDFGGLKRKLNANRIIPLGNAFFYEGSEDEKKKQELFDDFYHAIRDFSDRLEYWNKVSSIPILPIVLRNIGQSFEESIKIQLFFPKSVEIIRTNTFPRPERLKNLEYFTSCDNLLELLMKHSKDSKVLEAHNTGFYPQFIDIPNFDPFYNQSKDIEQLIDRYNSLIDYHFDFDYFTDQEDVNILEYEITELKPNNSIALSSFIFYRSLDSFSINYEISSKSSDKIFKGVLKINTASH